MPSGLVDHEGHAMDGNTFDRLTQIVSAAPSRRDLGRVLAGLLASGPQPSC
jgi:hypothetical protein